MHIITRVGIAAFILTFAAGHADAQNARAERLEVPPVTGGLKALPLSSPPGRIESLTILVPDDDKPRDFTIWMTVRPLAPGETLDAIEADFRDRQDKTCDGAAERDLGKTSENGYTTGEVVVTCDKPKAGSHAEFEVDKTIVSEAHVFTFQYTFERAYDDAGLQKAQAWLSQMKLCNPTAIFHPCP